MLFFYFLLELLMWLLMFVCFNRIFQKMHFISLPCVTKAMTHSHYLQQQQQNHKRWLRRRWSATTTIWKAFRNFNYKSFAHAWFEVILFIILLIHVESSERSYLVKQVHSTAHVQHRIILYIMGSPLHSASRSLK